MKATTLGSPRVPDPAVIRRERARRLAAPRADGDRVADGVALIVFRLGAERFALPMRAVERVEPIRWWSPVPGAPRPLAGVVNLQGEVLPLADLARLLGLEPAREGEGVALRLRGEEVCLRVDGVEEVLALPRDGLSSLARPSGLLGDDYVLGVLAGGITVLDARAVRAGIPSNGPPS